MSWYAFISKQNTVECDLISYKEHNSISKEYGLWISWFTASAVHGVTQRLDTVNRKLNTAEEERQKISPHIGSISFVWTESDVFSQWMIRYVIMITECVAVVRCY